jgi:gliding motility-associated-like protein
LISSSQLSCNISDTVSVTVTVIGDIEASLDSLSGCLGTPVTLGTQSLNNPYFTFQWSPTIGMDDPLSGQPTITIGGDELYKLIVTLEQCSDTLYQQITSIGGSREQIDTAFVCLFDTASIGLTSPYANGAIYDWQPESNLSSSSVYNPEFYALEASDYTLLISLPNGCADTFDLHATARTETFDLGPQLNVCAGQAISIGEIDSLNQFIYQWSPGNVLNDSTISNPTATIDTPTEFAVFRIPIAGGAICPGEGNRLVNIVAKPEAAFGIDISLACDGIALTILDSASGYTELHLIVNGDTSAFALGKLYEFPYSDSLKIAQIAINGACRDTLNFSTYIESLDKYYDENNSNVFSPNGDGLNDCFSLALSIKDAKLVTDFLPCSDLYVYDRWGRLVFSSLEVNSSSCWDGNTQQGNPCDEGVYFYVYRFKETEKAGTVHLRR